MWLTIVFYYVGSMSVCSFLTLSSHTACRDSAPALSLRANPVDPSKFAQLICPHEGVYFKSDNFPTASVRDREFLTSSSSSSLSSNTTDDTVWVANTVSALALH